MVTGSTHPVRPKTDIMCRQTSGHAVGDLLMKYIRQFLAEHKYLYLILLMIPAEIWFQYLELNVRPVFLMHTALDDRIPFVKEFVVFYVLWFLYVAFGLIYTALTSKRDFLRLFIFFCGGMVVANTIYTLFPNGQNLRPAVTGNDPFSAVIRIIYSTDTPTDVCPSLHVINAIAVDAALRHSEGFSKKKYRVVLSFLFAVLVCLSTVFIKQHSVVDVLGGLTVAAAFYFPLYLPSTHRALAGGGPHTVLKQENKD